MAYNPKKVVRPTVAQQPVPTVPEGFVAIYREGAKGMGVGGVYYETVGDGVVHIPAEYAAICVEAHGFEVVG